MKRNRVAATGTFAFLVLAGLAWAVQDPVLQGYLAFQARRPLSTVEAQALDRCEDPGWTGLSRVVEQDLDTRCSEVWLSSAMAAHLEDRELQWVIEVVADDARTPRQRLRGATALLASGHEPTADWPFLVTDPTIGAWPDYALALAEERLPPDHVDPLVRDLLDRQRFLEGDLEPAPAVLRWIRLVAARPSRLPAEERARWSTYLLELAGLPGDRLERALDRHRRGLGWQGVPPGLVGLIANHGEACAERSEPACLVLAADLFEAHLAGQDGGIADELGPPPPLALAPTPLWTVLYDDPRAVRAAAEALGDVGAWVGAGPEDRQAARLLGSVAWPAGGPAVDGGEAGLAGDPVDAIEARRAAPWTTALAALAIGEVAGVEVRVVAVGDGVRLAAGDLEAGVGPCGGPVEGLVTDAEPWPSKAVLAQAAVEGSLQALRGGDGSRAARLAALAERLDPVGAKGFREAVTSVGVAPAGAWSLGASGGAQVWSAPSPPPVGAEEARAARAAALLAGDLLTSDTCTPGRSPADTP